MTVTYSYAPEVEDIAVRLIAAHHTHLLDNGHVRVEYLFRSETQETNGKTVWGKARKVSSLNAFLAIPKDEASSDIAEAPEVEPFFVIEIAADVWRTISSKQRIALVDHELSHCRVRLTDGTVKLAVAPHDIEAFESDVRRHGLWRKDIEHFAKICADAGQMSLINDVDAQTRRSRKAISERRAWRTRKTES